MHGPGKAYLKWFHESNTWKDVHYRGVRTLKFPPDMWVYQEIFSEHRIEWVIETGSRHGGSALFFADMLNNRGASGKVLSLDNADYIAPLAKQNPRIEFISIDSGSAQAAELLRQKLPEERGRVFMILDSDHTAAHVLKELNHLVPLLRKGDYLVVEDTIVNGNPVLPDFGPGPLEAIREYRQNHPQSLLADTAREKKFGATFALEGFYIKQ